MELTTVRVVTTDTPYQVSISADNNHTWLADEPVSAGGGDTAPSPTQLLLSSLGACTAITLQMYAGRKAWPLRRVQVALQLNPDGKPDAGHTHIARHISLEGQLSGEQRERLLQIANACPLHKLLSGEIRINSVLTN